MGTKKILFFACLWLVTIGNAQVIRGYDYCHDTLAQRINIRKVARYVKIWEKYYRDREEEKYKRKIDRHYRRIEKYFSMKDDFEDKNYIEFYPSNSEERRVRVVTFFGAEDYPWGGNFFRTERYYDKKGHLLESKFYLDGCEIGPFRTFNSEGKLIKTTSTDDHYFISIEQLRDIVLRSLGVNIFGIYSYFSIEKIKEGDKYVYLLSFRSRGEYHPWCAYYIDAYDGKFLFKDVHYASYAKGEFEREHDYLKEKIPIPVRDSINIEDSY